MSLRLAALDLWLRLFERRRLARETSPAAARARMEQVALLATRTPGVRWRPGPIAGDPPLRALRTRRERVVLLWLHGGAYCLGSPSTHAPLVGALAKASGTGAVIPDYRLAPEHAFPAAVEDALAAWNGLRDEGWPADRIVLGGDSSGGGMVFALLHLLAAAGGAMPACVVAFSPWVDLTLSGRSLGTLAEREAMLPVERLAEIRDLYLRGADPRDPRASPHLGRFRGVPPVLIQASRAEVLVDDARMMAARLAADGVSVTLDLWPEVPHVWQFFHGRLPEADAALNRAASFVAEHLKTA
jgi:epsilon-lactone hydrolase